MTAEVVRIGAVADLHYLKGGQANPSALFEQAARRIDVLLLGGDLTDTGLPEEALALARDLASFRVPVLAVLGNHDYEAGREADIIAALREVGVTVLDGEAREVCGIGFAGTKGFMGGFGRGTLEPWGEKGVKVFVREAVDEALKLEGALARLRTPRRVALLHYAPIRATVEGEPVEIFPYLGCSRLEEALNRYEVDVVFHGHAHRGSPEGKTATGIPVFNVALPLLRRLDPSGLPLRIVELNPNREMPNPKHETRNESQ
jgi:Icc-related predicted phosphoesterase